MSQIVVVSGNPRVGSRTGVLAAAVGAAIGARAGSAPNPASPEAVLPGRADSAPLERSSGAESAVIEVGALGAGLLTPGDAATAEAVARLKEADILVVATPTYKGSYTGVLKVLLDLLPANALAGKRAVPVVTAGVRPQAAAAEALLRQLLRELGAGVVDPGLAVVEAELPDSVAIAEKYAAAHDW